MILGFQLHNWVTWGANECDLLTAGPCLEDMRRKQLWSPAPRASFRVATRGLVQEVLMLS